MFAAPVSRAVQRSRPMRETSVRRHAVAERLEVPLVGRSVRTGQRVEVVVVAVQPLAAGHELQPAEEQVEAVREGRAVPGSGCV